MAIDQNSEGGTICKVSYVLDSKIETGIDSRRITVTPMPYKDTTTSARSSRANSAPGVTDVLPNRVYDAPVRSNLEWLQ